MPESPKQETNSLVMHNRVFAWIAAGTGFVLLIPVIAMQLTSAVNWDLGDFGLMGLLLYAGGTAFVLVARKVPPRYWVAVGVGVATAFLYVWAELAVGILTNLGK